MSAAVRISGEPGGVGRFAVESNTHTGLAYVLEVSAAGVVKCDCLAGKAQRGCRHATAVREAWLAEPRPELEDQLQRSIDGLTASRQKKEARLKEIAKELSR